MNSKPIVHPDAHLTPPDTGQRGELWIHFKGDAYVVTDVVICSKTLERLVIYCDADNTRWARPLKEWNEVISRGEYYGPRFRIGTQ